MSAQEDTAVEAVAERPNVTVLETLEHPKVETPAEKPAAEVVETPAAEEVAADAAEDGQERDDKGRFKPKLQERIDELTRQRHEAQRESAYWRGIAEAKAEETKPAAESEPKPEDFEDYGGYVRALAKFEAKALVRAELAASETQRQEAAQVTTWKQRVEAAKVKLPDFDQAMSTSTAPMSKTMAQVIRESEQGPEVAYHLTQHPEVAARIAALQPLAAARELGKIEASLSAPKEAPQPKRITSAPVPPTTIGSGRSTVGDPGKMSQADYMEWRKTALRN